MDHNDDVGESRHGCSMSERSGAVEEADVVVIGAGFGGLGAAMGLAEHGARVVVCELLDYPGGCAGTFTRRGCRFDAGATLSSGLGEGQLFARWLQARGVALATARLDPVVELRAPGLHLEVCADRAKFVEHMVAQAGAQGAAVRRFFALQGAVAAALWPVLDDPEMLPPLGVAGLWRHATRLADYVPVVRWIGRPLLAVLRSFGIAELPLLRLFCDAVCQITVQCPASEAEAPFALATLDYFFRGTRHVFGGIGGLARALVTGLTQQGVTVHYHRPVQGLTREADGWRVETRRGPIRCRAVVANLLPQALAQLVGPSERMMRLTRLAGEVGTGWSAAMLYVQARAPAGAPAQAHHLELVGDAAAPLVEGNHLFASISGADEVERAPVGTRVITISTHLPAPRLRGLTDVQTAEYVASVQRRMREVFAAQAPEWAQNIEQSMTGSPRTFQRYTRRPGGLVGGVPRRAGLHNYRGAWPRPIAPGLWLVGDSVFPGQSTLATALGGLRAAQSIAAALRLRPALR